MNWSQYLEIVRHSFAQPWLLALFAVFPLLTIVGIFARRRRRRVLMRLGRLPALAALTQKRSGWQRLRSMCWMSGMSSLIFAIAGPQWGREPEPTTAPGRDLVIVFDASRSMLSDDVLPSRQERARQAILELLDSLQKRGGHRVALVAFAARADVICPLTHDYDHFREKLAEIDAAQLPLDLRPTEVSVSGTRFGEGLRIAALEAHDPSRRGFQDILMISDGDDPAEGKLAEKLDRAQTPEREWRLGTELCRELGIPIYTVGVGDADKGGKIPTRDGFYLTRDGKPVLTKLTEKPLKVMAEKTQGTYTAGRTGPLPVVDLFRGKIALGPKHEVLDDALPLYQQRYPLFLGSALFFLTAELILGRSSKKKKQAAPVDPKKTAKPLAA
ncbi:MAG: VWA domain-containing protein [Gemmataceae bacterium]|nr:VWA domain-containing protein [Gemmataceae bacterium]